MAMTVIVTRALPDRFRGFLASCMCEVAPGVFTSPHMNERVRGQVWSVLDEWFGHVDEGSVVMTWPSKREPGGLGLRTLGVPPREVVEYDGMVLVRRAPRESEET